MQGWFRHQQHIPQNWVFAVSPNGWTNQDIGLEWLKRCFEPHTRPQNANQKRLLLVDGHNSHTSLAFTEFAEKNGIVLLCFPAHATHLLQPLDVSIFGPLKSEYSKMVTVLAKSAITINKAQFLRIYIKIRDKVITTRAARASFKSVGIDTTLDASQVLAHLPQDHERTPEPGDTMLPRTPKNSHQLVSLASQLRSSERPDRTSRHLWTKMVKAASDFHSKSVLLQQEVTELRQTLAFRRIQAPGDQAQLARARVLDSGEIQAAILRKNTQKQAPRAPRSQIQVPSHQAEPRRSQTSCLSSPVPSTGPETSSVSSADTDIESSASESSIQAVGHDWDVDDYSEDEIDLL